MLGLDEYESSDEEGKEKEEVRVSQRVVPQSKDNTNDTKNATIVLEPSNTPTDPPPVQDTTQPLEGPMLGPPQDPTNGTTSTSAPASTSTSLPQSPYSHTRSIIRDLTLPPIPNFSVPASPPGSPITSTTTSKFSHFLELKSQGIHFNEKLAKSSALKNPSLLQKLMTFAGISEKEQYFSSIPKDCFDPLDLPYWAYKEELARSQQESRKREEELKREVGRTVVDFVPATDGGGGVGTGGGSGGAGVGRSAAERVMAGLADRREKSKTPTTNAVNGEREKRRRR
ncbi:MAG: Proteasome subunit beta type-6 [Watsoniomyces obsoletus]|nr:MAG: Proteasome subunit beta type-6 [Watsoniomyces obsoletus]